MNTRTTVVPSESSVSIRFLTSTADSSWAVPSDVSRSSSVLTTPRITAWASRMSDRRDDDDQQDRQDRVLEQREQPVLEVGGHLHRRLA